MSGARVSVMVLALVAVCIGVPGAASAQVGAALGGFVSDDTGASLPGVAVTITNTANGTTQVLVTGADGNYRAIGLSPAPYQVNVQLSGFAPETRTLTLTVGADAKVDFKLKVAGLQETVTVSGESPLVETARSEPTSVVLADQISALPVLDRSFLVLAQTLPGSAPLTAGNTTFASTKFGGPADQRNGYTTLIDGGSVDDTDWGSPIVNVSQDAVQEFKVYRNQFDAQYGAALVAVVSVATKSGTNRFAGSGYCFGRDEARRDQRIRDVEGALRSDPPRRVVRWPDGDEPDALFRGGRELNQDLAHPQGTNAGHLRVHRQLRRLPRHRKGRRAGSVHVEPRARRKKCSPRSTTGSHGEARRRDSVNLKSASSPSTSAAGRSAPRRPEMRRQMKNRCAGAAPPSIR